MAGSDESGEEMQSGRTNRAEDQTRIWAQAKSGEDFNGDVIFVVEAARDIEDDDFVEPNPGLHAIRGSSVGGTGVIGLSSGVADIDIVLATKVGVFGKGEIGVRGEGDPGIEGIGFSSGTGDGLGGGAGVIGRGGRRSEGERHGVGVVGLGGSHPGDTPAISDNVVAGAGVVGLGVGGEGTAEPSVGVIGKGGNSLPGGAAAPGIVGLSSLASPISSHASDTGVYGEGGTGVSGQGTVGPGVRGSGGPILVGDADPEVLQAGVVGEAGEGRGPDGSFIHGTGVIGLARDKSPLTFAETGETGVYGTGQTGVKGVGTVGRGGVFRSEHAAQVQLIPSQGTRIVEQAAFIPTIATDPGRSGPSLPRAGRGGDLMTVADDQGECTIWFCNRVGTPERPAKWSQILLGPSFDGRA